ncbi:MAG TPA: SWIM zinc finger family protein [Tepidisphaeraceae bacterium]
MNFEARYDGVSGIVNGLSSSSVAMATNTLREATYFEGTLARPLLFREAMGALYDVVVSDFKYRPRNRVAFFAWLAEQDRKFLAGLGVKRQDVRQRMEFAEARLAELDAARDVRRQPFYRARRAFFEYVYENEYELSYLLDPVITVHPDEVSFEAFSRDESTYARFAARFGKSEDGDGMFADVGNFICGTTNIDFSAKLHSELDRLRSYRQTRFEISSGGFGVATTEASAGGETAATAHKEKKIDLPDSWVMGFLQVHSTMTLGLTRLSLAPVDLFNIIRALRRRKTRRSPRALRFELTPGQRPRAVLEPWEHVIELTGSVAFNGPKPLTVRTWGRDRLRLLTRLLPVCQKVDLYLAGFGLPTIYVLDLGSAGTFTLALSGWTDKDWTGGAKFDLLSRRLTVTPDELSRTYDRLREVRVSTDTALAESSGLGVEKVRSAVSYLCQVGRAMVDLGAGGVFRHRDLFAEPFSPAAAIATTDKVAERNDERALAARAILEADNVRIIARRPMSDGYKLSGSAKGADNKRVRPLVHVDPTGQIKSAECTCDLFKKHGLTRGPCQHVLALRLAHMRKLESEDANGGEIIKTT